MSSFTHYLEEQILEHFFGTETVYLGLSREDGNRQGWYANWIEDPDGDGYIIDEDHEGIDEPGNGYQEVEDEEGEMIWVDEDMADLNAGYSRQSVGDADWHDAEIIGLEEHEGETQLRLAEDVVFTDEAPEDAQWGNISHFFFADSTGISSGEVLAYGSIPNALNVEHGMEVKIWANTIVIEMSG